MTDTPNTPQDQSSAHWRHWPPPRAPLPPHRLAKLANALGVSTPLPAFHNSTYSLNASFPPSPSFSSLRSQTPSATSMHSLSSTPITSKFLLHVIPPADLPHATDPNELDLTPLPASASGYHSQYRRGTLVPLHPTLQSQLLAIAKEYALPSTVGIVLYLVSSSPSRDSVNPTPNSDVSKLEWDDEEPGPRLSDAVWKHIWTRVLKVEREDALNFLSRTGTPDVAFPASVSSPSLLLDTAVPPSSLRPLISSPQKLEPSYPTTLAYPITPSPSTPSTSFDPHVTSQSVPKVLGSQSVTPSNGEMSPSVSSSSLEPNGDAFDLPGLRSSSLIPVLAKVEFDIDRRNALWYEPWIRSRRRNHAKRTANRARAMSDSTSSLNDDESTRAPLNLRLVGRLHTQSIPEFLREQGDGYAELDDESDDEEEVGLTFQFPAVPGAGDPLSDVFGTDADTWAEINVDRLPMKNPGIVNLALDGSSLSQQDFRDEQLHHPPDEDDVRELWDNHSRPQLPISIKSSVRSKGSPPGMAGGKKIPPPLNITLASTNRELVAPQGDSPMGSGGEDSAGLAYLGTTPQNGYLQVNGSTLTLSGPDGDVIKKSPIGIGFDDKRVGAIFDDDFGIVTNVDYNGQQYDDNDPYDRRKSQYVLKAKLDEIEKALVQFSPRALRTESADPSQLPARSSVSSSSTLLGPMGASPSKSSLKQRDRSQGSITPEDAVWPAVPYSVLSSTDVQGFSNDQSLLQSPPKWTLNGVSSVPPKSPYVGKNKTSKIMSEETQARQKYDDQNDPYPPLLAPPQPPRPLGSPVIPLSPDPFGRYPSGQPQYEHERVPREAGPVPAVPSRPYPHRNSSLAGLNERRDSTVPSSRFSMDSAASEDGAASQTNAPPRGNSLVSVKSIKKLWRRSNKGSVSSGPPPLPNATSDQQPIPPVPFPRDMPPQRGSTYLNNMVPPPTPSFPPPTPTLPSLPPSRAASRAESSADYLRFDGNSRYPIHPGRLSPSAQSVGPMSPGLQRSPSPSSPSTFAPPPPPSDRNANVRKSILKSWKSASGSISQLSDATRISSERDPAPPNFGRKRRQSVFDTVRGSVVSVADIPPTPTIPESMYNFPPPKPVNNRSSMRVKQPFPGSYSSTDSSIVSPFPTASPPRNGAPRVRQSSHGSDDSQSSWDHSSFDIVEVKSNPNVVRSSLSYPYHERDHQE